MYIVNYETKNTKSILNLSEPWGKDARFQGGLSQPMSSLLVTQRICSAVQSAHCILHTLFQYISRDEMQCRK